MKPLLFTEKESRVVEDGNCLTVVTDFGKAFYLVIEKRGETYYFICSYGVKNICVWDDEQLDALRQKRLDDLADKPQIPEEKQRNII